MFIPGGGAIHTSLSRSAYGNALGYRSKCFFIIYSFSL